MTASAAERASCQGDSPDEQGRVVHSHPRAFRDGRRNLRQGVVGRSIDASTLRPGRDDVAAAACPRREPRRRRPRTGLRTRRAARHRPTSMAIRTMTSSRHVWLPRTAASRRSGLWRQCAPFPFRSGRHGSPGCSRLRRSANCGRIARSWMVERSAENVSSRSGSPSYWTTAVQLASSTDRGDVPVPLHKRLRDLVVGSVSNRPSTRNTSASSGPPAAEVPTRPSSGAATEDAGSHGNLHRSPTSGLDDLPLAQGQELLGPCRDCSGYWTRELARGQKPLSCPVCKRLGPSA